MIFDIGKYGVRYLRETSHLLQLVNWGIKQSFVQFGQSFTMHQRALISVPTSQEHPIKQQKENNERSNAK